MTTIKLTKRKTNRRYGLILLLLLSFIVWIVYCLQMLSANVDTSHHEEEKHFQKRHTPTTDLRFPTDMNLHIQSDTDDNDEAISNIIQANVHLIDFQFHGFDLKDSIPYSATAKFCHLDWSQHKQNPSIVPMFKDLIHQSPSCSKTIIYKDLYQAVQAARKYDAQHKGKIQVMYPPRGIVFHESRVGSTLAANTLAAFQPERNRVYSESPPPITAAKLYESSNHPEQAIQLLQDVMYLMSRSNDIQERDTFFKIQSIGTKSIHVFRKAFPQTPWIFIFREPVQVMMSHLKTKSTKSAVCLRSRSRPDDDLKQIVQDSLGTSIGIQDLSVEEFCAAHLSTLCYKARDEVLDSNGLGKVVNYINLQEQLMEHIIPKHFLQGQDGDALDQDAKQRAYNVGEKYSKGRHEGKMWKEDSRAKENAAWPELQRASETFLLPIYKQLQELATK